ncbi:MAG: MucR family transcriptional regulator [Azospirillum sp.]|nr:MucR family transcriptional regulator [Azospirillum sp.]
MPLEPSELRQLTAQVVTAYVGNNAVSAPDLPTVISAVHAAFSRLGDPMPQEEAPAPAVPIRKSVHPDYIICLECGQKLKMLKRHLKTDHGMSPDEYRTKWGLPGEYPIVAPGYAKQRSELAIKSGLGRRSAA